MEYCAVPILIETEEIADLALRLLRENLIAVDMEADSLHHYSDKVCLLQISTESETFLVDPLQGADLSSLREVFSNPKIGKIFHAADYDIRCLARDFDFSIAGLFDTMIASQFVGRPRIGLADVLGHYFGLEIDKKYQRADWSLRPLPEEMVAYAAGDTRYLHQLKEKLETELRALGRSSWVEEECQLLQRVRHEVSDGPLFLRIKGAGVLRPRQLAALESLLHWRNRLAEKRDCPVFKVLGNKALIDIANVMPTTIRSFAQVESLYPRQVNRYGSEIIDSLEPVHKLPERELPVYPKKRRMVRDPAVEGGLKKLKQWRIKIADELQIDSGVLINNAALEAVARLQPESSEQLAAAAILKNWQFEVLGQGIVKALN